MLQICPELAFRFIYFVGFESTLGLASGALQRLQRHESTAWFQA